MGTKLNRVDIAIVEYNGHIYILQQYLHLCTGEVRSLFTRPVLAFRFDMTRFRVAFAWIRSILTAHVTTVACPYKGRGMYVCKSRCTRTRVQFKNPHSGEHS